MNTLKIEAKLAAKYKYKKLPDDLSEKYRNFWKENIPDFLSVYGGRIPLYTVYGSLICEWYDRIVIGDYGAFIEFPKSAICNDFEVAKGQEYRIYDERYSTRVKYHWFTISDGSDIKIYKQIRGVTYADYQPNKYYISVHEAFNMESVADVIIAKQKYGGNIMDVGSRNAYPANALSNFSPHPFEIDGVQCASMEGFLQSLKFKDVNIQIEVCKLVGIKAKNKGRNKKWYETQTLWWQGNPIKRDSQEYQDLLTRAYDALSENESFRKALKAAQNCTFTHSIGRRKIEETILTQREFCAQLNRLRDKLNS